MKVSRLCIAGGGTGGHVFPALALADLVRRRWPDLQVSFIGVRRGLESKVLPARGEDVLLLPMHGIKGAGVSQRLRVLLWELPRAVLHIGRRWRQSRPLLVIGVGGYASVAGVVAALLHRVPVILYEQNAVPGLVNRTLSRFCRAMLLGFEEAAASLAAEKCVHTGNFIPPELARVRWHPHTPPRLTVLGGSQGATFFNEIAPAACGRLKKAGRDFAVTHVAGEGKERIEALAAAYRRAGVEAELMPFCADMPTLYRKTDLLLTRAGAMTVSEVAAAGIPAIFIPLPHAADAHQWHNAQALVARGAARVIEQRECDPGMLAAQIARLLFDTEGLRRMSRAARVLRPQNGEERLLGLLSRWLEVPA